jgi:hypothetical protein
VYKEVMDFLEKKPIKEPEAFEAAAVTMET